MTHIFESRKSDSGKPRWSLVPFDAMGSVVEVLTYGADKYGEGNWKGLSDFENRYFNAAMRHLIAWKNGEKNDSESGKPHLAHAACCILFMLWKELNQKGDEDPI